MRIAAVIPCRDHGDKIAGAIASVLKQDYPADLVAVHVNDDASQDDSVEVAESAGATVWVLGQSFGPAACRNMLLRNIMEDFDCFAFLDADDRYYDTLAFKRVADAMSDPKVGLVYFDELYREQFPNRNFIRYRQPYDLDALSKSNIAGGSYFVSVEALKAVDHYDGPFDGRLQVGEMYDLAYRIAQKFTLVHIPVVSVEVNLDERSLRHTVPAHLWKGVVPHA